MKLTCSKSNLLEGVNTVQKAVSSRTTLPILQCILLQAQKDTFKLVGNDLELGIESKVSADIAEAGTVALEARMFSEIVKKLPDADITIQVDENNLTTLICEKSKFTISGQAGSEFIALPQVDKDKSITLSQLALKDMIRQTIFSIALEEIRPIFTGELFECKDNRINMVSVDGYRVSIRNIDLEKDVEDFKLVIPGKTLSEISKILNSDDEAVVNLYYTDKHVLFEIGQSVIVSRLLDGEFPKYDQMFSKDYETLINIGRRELMQSLERAALITSLSKKNPIKMQIDGKSLIITSNAEIGNGYEEIDVVKEGEDIEIAFNPKYLIDALKVIDDDRVNFQFTSSLNPCIIQQPEGDDYKYLVLPIRVN